MASPTALLVFTLLVFLFLFTILLLPDPRRGEKVYAVNYNHCRAFPIGIGRQVRRNRHRLATERTYLLISEPPAPTQEAEEAQLWREDYEKARRVRKKRRRQRKAADLPPNFGYKLPDIEELTESENERRQKKRFSANPEEGETETK